MASIHKNVRRTIDDFIELDELEKELTNKKSKKCKKCGDPVDSPIRQAMHCSKCTFERMSFDQKSKVDPTFLNDKDLNIDYVKCPICGYLSRSLQSHIIYQHKDISNKDFKLMYPDSPIICENERQIRSDKISGDKNPAFDHGGKFSPYSKKYIYYNEEQRLSSLAKASENRSYNTQLEYYTNKGLSEQEALEALSKRQTTFSLDRCIEQYGEELGYEKWKERQEKWQNTLKSKSDEEIAEINKKKISGGSISKSEKEIAEYVKSIFPETETQLFLKNNHNCYLYDICVGNKIIEYNGCYWHASPNRFNADDVVRIINECALTAQEIWDRDAVKLQVAKENGYEVLVIWENEFHSDKQGILNKCINFLTT
jgi:hypothetical protein